MCNVYVLWQQHWFKFWSYFLILGIIIYVFNYKYIFLMKLWIKKNLYGIIKKTFVMTPVNCVLYFTFRLIFQKETFFSTILVGLIITDFSWSSFSLFLPSEYFEWDFFGDFILGKPSDTEEDLFSKAFPKKKWMP